MWLALFLGSLYTTSLTHAFLTSLNSSSHLTTSESVNLSKKKKFPPHPHSVWTSNLPLLRICLTVFFSFFVFPSYPHSVLVSVSPFVLRSLLLSFIRYWFFSFDFHFDYFIVFLSFYHFLGPFFFFFSHFSQLHLRFSVHVLSFISGSPFHDFIGKW